MRWSAGQFYNLLVSSSIPAPHSETRKRQWGKKEGSKFKGKAFFSISDELISPGYSLLCCSVNIFWNIAYNSENKYFLGAIHFRKKWVRTLKHFVIQQRDTISFCDIPPLGCFKIFFTTDNQALRRKLFNRCVHCMDGVILVWSNHPQSLIFFQWAGEEIFILLDLIKFWFYLFNCWYWKSHQWNFCNWNFISL